MSTRQPLAVWLYGTRLATLTEDSAIDLRWTADAYERWGSNSRVMSNLLPITAPGSRPHPRSVKVFLDGLLPEGSGRLNYAMDAGLISEDTYGLISRYGRDTAGALVFQPPDEPEPVRVGRYETLAVAEVGQRLLAATRHAPTDPEQRGIESISLAGMQLKIGVHRSGSGWQAGKVGAPSTWIVKLAHPADSPAADVIDTEVLAIDLARRMGLTGITAEIVDFDGVRGIAVSRYDRTETPTGIGRIHQEDLAQALGINTNDPIRKFQRGNTIPSWRAAAGVLRNGGSEPDELLGLVAFNHMIGNTDLHAKNISILRHPDGTAELAPAYDMAMHMHHVGGEHLSALDINGGYHMDDIGAEDLIAEGTSWGLPARRARAIVSDTTQRLDAALDDVDHGRYPGVADAALDTVHARVHSTMRALDPVLVAGAKAVRADAAITGDIPVPPQPRGGQPVVGPRRRRGPRR